PKGRHGGGLFGARPRFLSVSSGRQPQNPAFDHARGLGRLGYRIVEQEPRQRDAGDRRVERVFAGPGRAKAVQQGSPDRVEIQPLVGPDTSKQLLAADSSRLPLRLGEDGDAQCSQQEGWVHLPDHRMAAGEQVRQRAIERPEGGAVESRCEQLAPDARRGSADLAWTEYPEDRPSLGQLVADTRGERPLTERPSDNNA